MSIRKNDEIEVASLKENECFYLPEENRSIRLMIEWISKDNGIIADLSLVIYCYDERARLIEKIDKNNPTGKDESYYLITNVESNLMTNSHLDCVKIDFGKVLSTTTAVLLFLDGGPRNFQYIQSVNIQCLRVSNEKNFGEFLQGKSNTKNLPLFKINGRTRKNYQGVALCALYKDGWNSDESNRWATRAFLEPLFVSTDKAKEEKCSALVVNAVPALDRYRPRLFGSIRDICAALSSHSLPKLKKKFQKTEAGLPIGQFTEVIFKQLFETHPKIIDESEAAYAVAQLQEMFHQIDYNGDSTTNWDEFTTFCVQTGVVSSGSNHADAGAGGGYSLDQYVIEYGEEQLHRDRVLSAYRHVSVMHHVRDIKKILLVSEDSDNISILDENFRLNAQIYPSKIQVMGDNGGYDGQKAASFVARAMIYDVCYLSKRDLYAYCSSDHSITICKEFGSISGKKTSFLQHNRFYHSLLHLKLCWSARQELLCSAASDRTIYGWNIDSANILFQITRHGDNITDFLCVDALDLFITSSMDKRIVLWSTVSRRVKGILVGHKRGVRGVSVYENILLSAGFECEAKIWDIVTKENTAILKGHRHPVAAAKLMCERAQNEKEYRAISVDESGEFRLWNIYVRERTSEPVLVPTIQIFEMANSESPLNNFKFLAVPYNPAHSTSYYSDLIACSTKLLHFLPEKNVKEFVPPTACVFSEYASAVMTATGKSLLTYDVSNGQFSDAFEEVSSSDITALCLDGERGRRIYVGNTFGELLLVNSMNGGGIDKVRFHSRDITAIRQNKTSRNCVYTASLDGHIRVIEENGGKLHIHNSVDNAFGEGLGILGLKVAPTLKVLIAFSSSKSWGMWHETSLKKLLIAHEDEPVTAIEVIGASRDKESDEYVSSGQQQKTHSHETSHRAHHQSNGQFLIEKENILSVAIAMSFSIHVYTFDVLEMRGIKSMVLTYDRPLYYCDLSLIKSPDSNSVNYSSIRASVSAGSSSQGYQLAAATDDGILVMWDTSKLRFQAESKFKKRFKGVPLTRRSFKVAQETTTDAEHGAGGAPSKYSGGATGVHHTLTSPPSSAAAATAIDGSRRPSLAQSDVTVGSGGTKGVKFTESATKIVSPTKPMLPVLQKAKSMKILPSQREQLFSPETPLTAATTTVSTQPIPVAENIFDKSSRKMPPSASTSALTQSAGTGGGGGGGSISSTQGHAHAMHNKGSREAANDVVSKAHRANHTISWLEAKSSKLFSLPLNERTPPVMRHSKSWNAHSDSIPLLVAMNAHSSFVTVSLDGYHRVWNLDTECLGELVLPNITEQMKNSSICKDPGSSWRFILELIPVHKHHIDIANHLVKSLVNINYEKAASPHFNDRRRAKNFNYTDLKDTLDSSKDELHSAEEIGDEQSKLRTGMLKSMVRPPSPPDDAPPSRLPTKEEKDFIRLTLLMDDSHTDHISNVFDNNMTLELNTQRNGTVGGGAMSAPGMLESFKKNASPAATAVQNASSISASKSNAPSRVGTTSNMPSRIGSPESGTLRSPSKSLAPRKSLSPSKQLQLTQSLFANNANSGSNVLLSAFGIPSLWYEPGERDIFGNSTQVMKSNIPEKRIPPAFSEASIMTGLKENVLDPESMRILRKLGKDFDKVSVYERCQPTLLLRSPAMSTKVELPTLDSIRKAEINFGSQKDMYKNAEEVMNDFNTLPKTVIRGAIAKSRIEQNVRKINSMVHLIEPPSHNEVILPKAKSDKDDDDENNKLRSDEQKMRLRLMKSAALVPPDLAYNARPLDKNSINRWISKVKNATELSGEKYGNKSDNVKKKRKKEVLSQAGINILEKKMEKAIRGEYRSRNARLLRQQQQQMEGVGSATTPSVNRQRGTINTRALLPFYRLENIHQFMDIFAKVDENFSGDLDVNEWIRLFTSLDESIPEYEARMIFMKIDKDADGFLSMRELVPVVFNRATREQQKIIITYAETELTKQHGDNVPMMTAAELTQLFEAYDVDGMGFVDVSLIKERIRNMRLNEHVLFSFMDSISDLADDEMVNLVEFLRLFKAIYNK